jgi:hypothetical protein
VPDVLFLRLLPSKPIKPADFRSLITGLEITVYDLSVGAPPSPSTGPTVGTQIGKVTKVVAQPATGPDPAQATIDFTSSGFTDGAILQQFTETVPGFPAPPPNLIREMNSVATAVIVVSPVPPNANYPEYPARPSYDIRVELKRGGRTVKLKRAEFNVVGVTRSLASLSNDQGNFFEGGTFESSAYITLPAAIADPTTIAGVDLTENGVPPAFRELSGEINKVLAKDPGGGATLVSMSPLTLAQSRQIAAEIVWNRTLDPTPLPKRSLNELYTLPSVGDLDEKVDNDRKKFEAELAGYHGTRDGVVLRLATFVYSASAAIASEAITAARTSALLDYAVIAGTPPASGVVTATVPFSNGGLALSPAVIVPAEFFYALGASLPPQIGVERRVEMATLETEQRTLDQFAIAIDGGWINDVAPAVNPITAAQASRRLRALRPDASQIPAIAEVDIALVVTAWLGYLGESAALPTFWDGVSTAGNAARRKQYLTIVLWSVTKGSKPLVDQIVADFGPMTTAADVPAVTEDGWRTFFGNHPTLLPDFTLPGTPAERTEAFIRYLKQFFSVAFSASTPQAVEGGGPPTLGLSITDVVGWFSNAWHTATSTDFKFSAYPWNDADVETALGTMFDASPDGVAARCWLKQALTTVGELTALSKVGPPELGFSLMEALFARGFTSKADVAGLNAADFAEALTGTIAYRYATQIQGASGPTTAVSPLVPGPFRPVNPDGSLDNCVPPPTRSPLGPIEYLHELLLVAAAMTCEEPLCPDDKAASSPTIGDLLADRRGPLGDLLTSRANLEVPLPVIDLVNESLEHLVDTLPAVGGAVYNTAADQLGGHELRPVGSEPPPTDVLPYPHDPDVLFEVMPEHSSPATPQQAGVTAYDTLRADVSSPILPYDQALDVNRTYLGALGTSRFAAMRRFREDITEFVIDPTTPPAKFQSHLWRYPVREDIAREYLGITPDVDQLLFGTPPAPASPIVLWELYGFPTAVVDGKPWTDIASIVSEFLERTGIAYCDLVELQSAAYVEFLIGDANGLLHAGTKEEGVLDECEPCCLEDLTITFVDPSDATLALHELAVFIRLWRLLQDVTNAAYSFAELRDTCDVLELFSGGSPNPDFVRQLAAFQMLRDNLELPLTDDQAPVTPTGVGAHRTKILALWAKPPNVPPQAVADWAIAELLERLPAYAIHKLAAEPAGSEFVKLLRENLEPLSVLCGFGPSSGPSDWRAHPTNTLRLVEVLAKIYASPFGVGEILFLFTVMAHRDGDDPFALASGNETLDDPLDLPDDEDQFSLWALRRKLLAVEVAAEDLEAWPWWRVEAALREEFGFGPPTATDPILAIGKHMFPSLLEAAGQPVAPVDRRYESAVIAAPTSAQMWNTPPSGPFRFDAVSKVLWTELPLTDDAILQKLARLRPLTNEERDAVRTLRAKPLADLAPLDFLFQNFAEAEQRIVQEPDESRRWAYFLRAFLTTRARCEVIAEHLAGHVDQATGRDQDDGSTPPVALATHLLRSLHADENQATTDWEVPDAGTPPPNHLWNGPNGRALPALLGLVGTGLLTEYRNSAGTLVWREPSSSLDAFGDRRNQSNACLPTVLPGIDDVLPSDQSRFMGIRNGFGIENGSAQILGGISGFTVSWDGELLVEDEGDHVFKAGAPVADGDPDVDAAQGARWRVRLNRGDRTWVLLSHHWPDEDAAAGTSSPVFLRRGIYHLSVDYVRRPTDFDGPEDVCPQETGLQLKYVGPDTDGQLIVVPRNRLFIPFKDGLLTDAIDGAAVENLTATESALLVGRFTSTIRDIRRTYERAFKALLFARRNDLSAEPIADDRESEAGLLLRLASEFQRTSYIKSGATYKDHHADLDFDFLPVDDNFRPPPVGQDHRVDPSTKRRQAMFDWWERIYDYTVLRTEATIAPERPVWFLFHEADEEHTDDPAQLLRHLAIDLRHEEIIQTYSAPSLPGGVLDLTWQELVDERWAIRAWTADRWLHGVSNHWLLNDVRDAEPATWVVDDPEPNGNANLTKLLEDGAFENGRPRRYDDVHRLNGLRERARAALVAYLCGMDRVALPWGSGATAKVVRDLSDLLLQDVAVGGCERATRIEDAIGAVQGFVTRARLGFEPNFPVSEAFALYWDRTFATFEVWETCKRRELYRENWIEWDELEKARRVEAFRFLEDELRRSALTIAVPGGMEWWPGRRPPMHPTLELLQAREPAGIKLLLQGPPPDGNQPERLGLLGTPERDARPSWLAPVVRDAVTWIPPVRDGDGDDGKGDGNGDGDGDETGHDDVPTPMILAHADTGDTRMFDETGTSNGTGTSDGTSLPVDTDRLPFWIQAAIRLGARFVRVAAAGTPPASTAFLPRQADATTGCCDDCGRIHPPTIDEYYFWLADGRRFESADQVQDADVGAVEGDPTSDWYRPEKLPGLLDWPSRPVVHLRWSRVHNGEFQPPRRSTEGLRVDPGNAPIGIPPQLAFMGRQGDSLRFEVSKGVADPGLAQDPLPGFRFDLATDTAIVVPVVEPDVPIDPPAFPGELAAYPYFLYFAPGAHVEPPSLFSVGMTVAGTLRSHCRFEAALKWYELAADPLHRDNAWAICPDEPRTADQPEGDGDGPVGVVVLAEQPATGDTGTFDGVSSDTGTDDGAALDGRAGGGAGTGHSPEGIPEGGGESIPEGGGSTPDRGETPPLTVARTCCPTAPATDPIARDRATLLAWSETLLDWAGALLCKNTPEAFRQAAVILDALDRVLGERPTTIYLADDPTAAVKVSEFAPDDPPLNARLLSLYDRTADRLSLIHTCQNARRRRNGRPKIDMPYFGDSRWIDGWQTTTDVCVDESEWCLACCSPYRFMFLVQKALELAGEVRNFGAQLLQAYEKGDAEHLAAIRASHERQLLELALQVRQHQWRDADWQVQALQKTKEGAQTRLRYYQNLIANGLNAGEVAYEALTGVSIASRTAGTILEAIAQTMGVVPDMWIGIAGIGGSPLQFNQLPLGTKLAGGFATAARIMNILAEIASSSAGLSLTEGGWTRREDEWRHLVEVTSIEIEMIERQKLGAERRRDAALRELNDHQRQVEHAGEIQDFVRDKFTNEELYLYYQRETASLHRQSYELLKRAFHQTQSAYNIERGYTAETFDPIEDWDDLHEGLLSGERLGFALRRMEKAYLDANCREYELTKHISLRLNFPEAFLRLQATGQCEVELPEWLFDLDYPGQYMRRIKNMSLTVPAVVGPYTGIHCRVTLLSSQTRIDPRLLPIPEGCCDGSLPANGYEPQPDDPRIVHRYAATDAIATSSGQNDSGLFELSFRDERYLPFEYGGAVSRWRIELPPENNAFDFDSLSDVVLHLNYTSREGGDVLRAAANELAQARLPGAGVRFFNVRNEMPDAWARFQAGQPDPTAARDLDVRLSRQMFPFLQGRKPIAVRRLELLFEAPGADPAAHHPVLYLGPEHAEHGGNARCGCHAWTVECAASAEWPGLFHGVVPDAAFVDATRVPAQPHIAGTVHFPSQLPISNAYLFCGYAIAEPTSA